jgi:hypothetical protein
MAEKTILKPKAKQVFIRLSVDFVVSEEENDRIQSKYISMLDEDGKEIVSGELYLIGHEDEDGDECDEEGNKNTFL